MGVFARLQVPFGQASGGTKVLAIGVADQITRLRFFAGTVAAAATVQFVDSDGNPLSGAMPLAINGGLVIPASREEDLCIAAPAGKGISIITSAPCHGVAIFTRHPG